MRNQGIRAGGMIGILAVIASTLFAGVAATNSTDRLHEAALVFSAITATSGAGIPREVMERAKCVVIIPAARKQAGPDRIGFVSCRAAANNWSTPGAVRMEGAGAQGDVVMLVMDDRGVRKLLDSGLTVGTDEDVASWSRSHGVFAGVSLRGARLREDLDDNQTIYGARISNRDIVGQPRLTPALNQTLVRYLPARQ